MNYDIEEVVFMYFDKFLDSLKLAFRQKSAVYDAVEFFKNFFLNGFSIKKIFVGFMVVIELLGCLVLDTPRTPRGQELNLDGYSLVFFDDGDFQLNRNSAADRANLRRSLNICRHREKQQL